MLGASGGIGQPLSLLMKLNPRVSELALYDIRGGPGTFNGIRSIRSSRASRVSAYLAPDSLSRVVAELVRCAGVAADVSHINTKSTVTGYDPTPTGLAKALKGTDVVLIPAGVPRKPGMTRDDLFNTNASIVRDLAKACAENCPEANLLVISNPVNSTVPICSEVYKSRGVYNPKRLFGVTTLDVVRASRFVSAIKGSNPADEKITVVGGHSGVTIVPLFSQSSHPDLSSNAELIRRVQFGGDEVVKAKDGAGSATLSMAMAGARMAESVIRASQGDKGVVEPSFVDSPLYKDQGIDFFASKVELGPSGVEKILPIGEVDGNEKKLLEACLTDLKKNIEKGVAFVSANPAK